MQKIILIFLSLFIISSCDLIENRWRNAKLPILNKEMLLSKAWLDTIRTNPLELRQYGIKGKKKLVELFDAYLAVYNLVSARERKFIDRRLYDIAKITQHPEYHNMAFIDDEQFKEDATSYLRLCYLLERRGFNTAVYRQEIKKIIPRLNAHMPERGINQQMTFHWYYSYFAIEEPFPSDKSFTKGIIAQKLDTKAMDEKDAYDLTHEIFAIYEYGDKPNVDFFTENDRIYLKNTLKELIIRYTASRDPDLTAELIICTELLKMQNDPVFKKAIDYLLSSQNSDGSFGNYERLHLIYGDYVKEGYYLHTTGVVIKALSLAFNDKAKAKVKGNPKLKPQPLLKK